jgi:hypothetical protein
MDEGGREREKGKHKEWGKEGLLMRSVASVAQRPLISVINSGRPYRTALRPQGMMNAEMAPALEPV